ncbi:helix-turn-helix domain-containing protein [Spongiimicrobium salis]|uniref:helix-turn-helix domain-containing protein n=1 Tax=Spongiimicrobium salis TaxID=1667022 RepID=UPI00374D8713
MVNKKGYGNLGLHLLLFLVLSLRGFSQEHIALTKNQIDFISSAPEKEVNDSLRYYYDKVRKDVLVAYSHEYLKRGEIQDNEQIKYIANFYLSHCYFYYRSDYSTSFNYAHSALIAARKTKNPNRVIRALQLKGSALDELGKYPDALECFLESARLARENGFLVSEIRSRLYIGNIKIRLKDYSGGKPIYQDILERLEEQKYKSQYENSAIIAQYNRTYASSLNRLGICLRGLEESNKALLTFNKALSFMESREMYEKEILEASIYTNLGKTHINLGDHERAIFYLRKSEAFLLETKNTSNVYFQNIFFQAEAEWKLNKPLNALEILEKGFDHLSSDEYPPKLLEMYDLAVLLSKELGDLEKENEYSRRRREVSDAIHENDVTTRVLENRALSKENKILSSKNEIIGDNLKFTLKLLGILVVLLLIIVIIYLRNAKLNKRKFDVLALKMENEVHIPKKNYPSLKIADEKAKVILEKLQKLEHAHFYISKDCTLHSTSKKLKTNTTYLSKIINGHMQKSFNEYINEMRIYYVLEQIKENSKYRNYTIDAIAKELGYKSTNTFTNAFKKYTGLKPSFYIKKMEKTTASKE